MSARPWRMVASSQPNKSALYLQPPCPSFSASTAAYLRRSFSDKDWYSIRIWCSMCAEYMVYLPDRKQTGSAPDTFQRKTATRNREVILRLPLNYDVRLFDDDDLRLIQSLPITHLNGLVTDATPVEKALTHLTAQQQAALV